MKYSLSNNELYLQCNNYSVNELLKLKEELTKERDEQLGDIVKLRESLNDAQNKQGNMEQQQSESNQKIQEVISVLNCLMLMSVIFFTGGSCQYFH